MSQPHRKHLSPKSLVLGTVSLLAIQLMAVGEPISLVESTIIETVNEVEILSGNDMKPTQAEPDMLFRSPDFLQTGRKSRARLEAKDGTVTRVGANTLFSFEEKNRTINLQKGSLLFHSPTGRGGGRIVTASATASIIGTTIAVAATPNGGFKLLVLEGVAEVVFPDGTIRLLEAGQMTFVLPGESGATIKKANASGAGNKEGDNAGKPGPVLNFDLKRLKEGSDLLNGFDEPLSSDNLINTAIDDQQQQITSGELNETGARILSLSGDSNLVLDVSESELTNTTNDIRKEIETADDLTKYTDPAALEKLSNAITGELTPQVDGYQEEFHFFPAPGVTIPADFSGGFQGGEVAQGLIAGRINFITGSLDLAPILVDPSSPVAHYIFRAIDTINIDGSIDLFSGSEPSSFVEISALEAMNITNGSNIFLNSQYPTGLLLNVSNSNFDIDNVYISNLQGRIELMSGQEILISNSIVESGPGTILFDRTTDMGSIEGPIEGPISSPTEALIEASLLLGGKSIAVNNSQLVAEDFNLIEASQTISIDASIVAANFIEFKAASISGSGNEFFGSQLQLIGDDLIDFRYSDLSSLSEVQMEARTLVLADIQFSSSSNVRLGSAMGMLAPNPNTGASAVTGYVNFINFVDMDGSPAEFFVPTSQGGLASPGTEAIEIYAIGATAR